MAFEFNPPLGKPWLLYGLLGASLLLNVVMVLKGDGADAPAANAAVADAAGADPAAAPVDPNAPAVVTPPPAPVAAAPVAIPAGWQLTTAEVSQTLANTFRNAVGADGDALAAVFARLYVWDLDLRRDVLAGDRVEVIWGKDPAGTLVISAARLHSKKHGKIYTAYQWTAPGDTYPSYWKEDGTEVPFRLQDTPVEQYEQITSLLKDRPTHKGMDFKAPVGVPTISPRNGTVTRVNWNWAGNGNCVEVQFDDGAIAKYLHLSENKVQPGQRVAKGDVVGLIGNTGHSTAAHLHYQVEVGGKVVDPLDYHGAVRRKVDPNQSPSFQAETARLAAQLNQAVAAR